MFTWVRGGYIDAKVELLIEMQFTLCVHTCVISTNSPR